MKSIIYRSPHLYRLAMHIFHGRALGERYKVISGFIEKGERVLDLGCGTGTLQSHLNGNDYLGIDLNEAFVGYGRRKGRDLRHMDATKYKGFGEFDVCVIMDLLHHIAPKHETFMQKVLRETRNKVIVCEPYEDSRKPGVVRWLNKVLDDDGINPAHQWMTKPQLVSFYQKFQPKRIDEVGGSIVALFEKAKTPSRGRRELLRVSQH